MLKGITKRTRIEIAKSVAHISYRILPKTTRIKDNPIVILGMHRSGTSLLAQILNDFGVFMGHTLKKHLEADFFRNANEWILRRARGNWDMPINAQYLLEAPKSRIIVERKLRKQIISNRFLQSYIGPSNIDAFYRNPKFIWGWKDPRTTITWPAWHWVFPRAKYVFIYRNGVDAAQSLKAREKRRKSLNLRPLSLRCSDLDGAFSLWEEYNRMFYKCLEKYNDINLLQICFENLLVNPIREMKRLNDFIGTSLDEPKIAKISGIINRKKRYSFLKSPSLIEFCNRKRNSPLMRKFGYDNIKSNKEIEAEALK